MAPCYQRPFGDIGPDGAHVIKKTARTVRKDQAIEEMVSRVWENLVGRTDGPLTLRLFIQPTVATIFAIRAGLRDSRQGQRPYFWNALLNPGNRRDLLAEGWKDVGKLFIMACVLDVVYQLIVARWVYPVETVIVAIVLAILPYVMVRGLVCRVVKRRQHKHNDVPAP